MVQWFDLRKEGRLLLKYCNINNSLVHKIVNKFQNSIEVYFIFFSKLPSVFSSQTADLEVQSLKTSCLAAYFRLTNFNVSFKQVDRSRVTLLPKLSPLTHMRTKRPSTPQISSYSEKQTPVILVMIAETNYELSGLH